MNKPHSYGKIIAISFAVAILSLPFKFGMRFLFGSNIIKGDEVPDTIIMFVMLLVVLCIFRSATIRQNAIDEIHSDQKNRDDVHSRK